MSGPDGCLSASGDVMLIRPPAARAARHAAAQRLHRQREREGVLMVTLPLTPAHVAKIASVVPIFDHELEDRAAIRDALLAVLDSIRPPPSR